MNGKSLPQPIITQSTDAFITTPIPNVPSAQMQDLGTPNPIWNSK